MRVKVMIAGVAAAAALGALWWSGGFAILAWWIVGLQRELQSTLAAEITALRGGEPHALAGLLGFCAAYGFLHAVGPGHGKLLVAGAAVGSAASARRMAGIAVAGSLAQALFALVLVYGGLALVGATARATIGASETWALPFGHAAVAAIGLTIAVRGLRTWRVARPGHGHHHDADHACGCGHDHGPDLRTAAAATGFAATAGLVGAMAVRPCSGAMMLLAIAWSMGLAAAGAAGVLAMGLGTAAFTVVVALLAVSGRETTLASFGDGRAARLLPALQIGAGLLLAVSGTTLLVSSLPA